jgi:lysozyme
MAMSAMTYGKDGMELTKQFEGVRLSSYRDGGGVLTIGYGHTKDVRPFQICTTEEANQWLMDDVREAVNGVNAALQVEVTQAQFDALVDWTFNCGVQGMTHSTLMRKLNAGDEEGAAAEFDRWCMDNGVKVAGLARRRDAEEALFRSDMG